MLFVFLIIWNLLHVCNNASCLSLWLNETAFCNASYCTRIGVISLSPNSLPGKGSHVIFLKVPVPLYFHISNFTGIEWSMGTTYIWD